MLVSRNNKTINIKLQRKQIEQVESFNYLDSITEKHGKIEMEINDRMGRTGNSFNMINTTF